MRNLIILLAGLLISSGCFATVDNNFNQEILQQISSNEEFCVEKIDEEKVYLNHDCLLSTKSGILLNLNGADFILLNTIHSDTGGIYIEAFDPLNTCPHCGQRYFVFCRNPDCPGKKR